MRERGSLTLTASYKSHLTLYHGHCLPLPWPCSTLPLTCWAPLLQLLPPLSIPQDPSQFPHPSELLLTHFPQRPHLTLLVSALTPPPERPSLASLLSATSLGFILITLTVI